MKFTSKLLFKFLLLSVASARLGKTGKHRMLEQFDNFLDQPQPNLVSSTSGSFIPLQLGPTTTAFAMSENDIFRSYKLDVRDGESPIKDHVFVGETEAVPFVHTTGYSSLVQSSREVTDRMGIQGALSVSYGPMISGSGAGRFMKENVASKNQVSFIYKVTHTAFARKAKVQTIMPNGLIDGKGTRFIESLIYGAQLDVRYTITAEEDVDIQEIEAELQGKIGVGPLSVGFSASFEKKEGQRSSRYSMKIEAKASGVNFPIPPTLGYENFDEMNRYITEFNDDYESLFNGLSDQPTVDTETNILKQLSPIGFTLGQSADYTDVLDLLDSLALESRLEDLQKVFFEALEWKATLRRSMEFAEREYGNDPALNNNVYKPYEAIALGYDEKLETQIDACLAFRSSAMDSAAVPDLYPVGDEKRVFEGLSGEGYIPADLTLLGKTYEGLHYIGFTVPVEDSLTVKPWLSGTVRDHQNSVIATGKTPEDIQAVLDGTKDEEGPKNLIVNGSFEANPVPLTQYKKVNIATVPGWNPNTSTNVMEIWGSGHNGISAPDGVNFVELDVGSGTHGEGFYQDIQTVSGQRYLLEFSMRARRQAYFFNADESVVIEWNGEKPSHVGYFAYKDWQPKSVVLIGTGGQDRLTIRESTNKSNGVGALIDDVRLTPLNF